MKLTLDLHLHSAASQDGRMTIEEIAAAARARGLDGVAVTDHDLVYTGPRELEGVLLIPGAEFTTEHGHLLGLFLEEPMAYTTWAETARAIRAQGGLTVLAHPFQHKKDQARLLPLLPQLDGMEVWNGRADRKNPRANAQAAAFARAHGLFPTAGSDAHVAREVGNGRLTLEVEGPSLPAIRAALLQGQGRVSGRAGRSLDVARSQWTKLKKTQAPPLRYGTWAAFALKCAWEDQKRIHRKGEADQCP